MKLNEIRDNKGARKSRVRVGRGIGSGVGKTGGRGQKGQKSRSGVSVYGFEGGQMPLHMRLPKRGFNNIFAKDYAEVNLGAIQKLVDAKQLDAKGVIDHGALKAAGVARGGRPRPASRSPACRRARARRSRRPAAPSSSSRSSPPPRRPRRRRTARSRARTPESPCRRLQADKPQAITI